MRACEMSEPCSAPCSHLPNLEKKTVVLLTYLAADALKGLLMSQPLWKGSQASVQMEIVRFAAQLVEHWSFERYQGKGHPTAWCR